MAYLKKAGAVIACMPLEQVDEFIALNGLNPNEVEVEPNPDEIKQSIRQGINATAEPMTREGVISDVAAVLVVGLAQTVKALASGKDLAEVKAALASLQPFADAVLTTLATPTDLKDPVKALAAGRVVMPYMVKGDAGKVVHDMGQLANGVSAALLEAKKAA